MSEFDDNKPAKLPRKFRASLDQKGDALGYAILKNNDQVQAELGEKINAPFVPNTPLERSMSKAFEQIRAIERTANFTPETIEVLAESYATIGRYDTAAELSRDPQRIKHYKKVWDAVWLPDEKWCEHAPQHKFVSENLFSVKEGREMPLLACNICGMLNVLDMPADLAARQQREAQIRAATRGMTMSQVRNYLAQNVKR